MVPSMQSIRLPSYMSPWPVSYGHQKAGDSNFGPRCAGRVKQNKREKGFGPLSCKTVIWTSWVTCIVKTLLWYISCQQAHFTALWNRAHFTAPQQKNKVMKVYCKVPVKVHLWWPLGPPSAVELHGQHQSAARELCEKAVLGPLLCYRIINH